VSIEGGNIGLQDHQLADYYISVNVARNKPLALMLDSTSTMHSNSRFQQPGTTGSCIPMPDTSGKMFRRYKLSTSKSSLSLWGSLPVDIS
jgi:hypothetical protein